MQQARLFLRVNQGVSFARTLRIMRNAERAYAQINHIEAAAPVRIHAPGHGLTGIWPIWIRGVTGSTQLNREIGRQAPHMAEAIDSDTLVIRAIDTTGSRPSGGRIVYMPPLDITDATARLQVREYPGSPTVLLELASELPKPAPAPTSPAPTDPATPPAEQPPTSDPAPVTPAVPVVPGITIENPGVLRLRLDDTAALKWTQGVYDLVLTFSNGLVMRALSGEIMVSPEVTR